ncbi:T9SS type B sorting domain-containing protein [Sediminibacterium soli]|uniref:T9SS type B sorting domain-containing protein n=1 Tax=Sediminibacterium soli TaxID=2698829 RepID=UPI0013794930|nr:T9SS type B sorting domain-containing protein [Sediminibacterium soli]NCI47281.1 T9SS type B sorting domain-containing protein [Sediminibacterium soli]
MKRVPCILLLVCCCLTAMGRHVAGGELYYEYLRTGSSGSSVYQVTLRLFRDCQSLGPLLQNENPILGVYENNTLIKSQQLPIQFPVRTIQLNTSGFPCLVGSVNVCYEVAIYTAVIELQDNQAGYTLSRIGCCRVDTISNLSQPRNVGSNYITRIPGKIALPSGHNSSPQFNVKDTALVCANKSFQLDFGAVDPDRDSLSFALCEAYTSSGGGNNNAPPTPTLNLIPLPYRSPFDGGNPLGSKVSINSATGIISGIAPAQGQYVVNVCITEWRNGKPFTEHRKDFILKVQNCDFVEAVLPDRIVQCKDFTVHFENESTSSAVTSYTWTLYNAKLPGDIISNAPVLDYTYPDTGVYKAKLHVTGPAGCEGDDSTLVLVYPGFRPGFLVTGSCYQRPYQFTDTSYTRYGVIDSWKWNFGDDTTLADTSRIKNPLYKYASPSEKDISLVVTSNKGCIDSVHTKLPVADKPVLLLPFEDTLICSIDTLAIPVGNSGSISWLPAKNIIGANTSRPLVFPKDTTRYLVTVNDNGCINTDTVTVNVLPFISVFAGNDSVICRTDSMRLQPVSHALAYCWTSSADDLHSQQKYPWVQPSATTDYYVVANLGRCQAKDTVRIKVADYPLAAAGMDTTICFGSRAQLHAQVKGSAFTWAPAGSLVNTRSVNPVAGPSVSTAYVLSVSDTLGCPKTVRDTILVYVTPTLVTDAGPDTTIVPGQSLQLQATGGTAYQWSPATGLSNTDIANPVALLGEDIDSIRYRVRVSVGSCFTDDEVLVRVSKHGPEIYVPSAFTPNDDGRNDVLKPALVGISNLYYFRVYNRWGQQLFHTAQAGKGWDGVYNGVKQPPGTYVYQVEGSDYLGKKVFRKGTSVLIR